MNFHSTVLSGVLIVEPDLIRDERGCFARMFDDTAFARAGLETVFVQSSISFNPTRGTLRGMHFQQQPHAEAKLIRCTRGAIFDAVVDLRPDSPTRGRSFSVELSEENRLALYVPRLFAHGFLTLREATEVLYQMSDRYEPHSASGVRWDDPAFGIDWPVSPTLISARDSAYPDWA